MSYYPDLSVCSFLDSHEPSKFQAVGWLERGRDFPRGEVSPEFITALSALLVDPWQPAATAGRHPCSFCRFSGGPAQFHYGSSVVELGTRLLFVPTETAAFVAPSLIVHYVDAHEYFPPLAFQAAVMACPPMRSAEYLRCLARVGAVALTRRRRET